jgi:hypothetical protein
MLSIERKQGCLSFFILAPNAHGTVMSHEMFVESTLLQKGLSEFTLKHPKGNSSKNIAHTSMTPL